MIDPLLQQLLRGFVDEGQEICDRITRDLLELEHAPRIDAAVFDELARGLHTLKGSAATLGLDELSELAHRMEDVALPLRGSQEPFPAPVADALLRTCDRWLANLKAAADETPPPPLSAAFAELRELTVYGLQSTERSEPPPPGPAVAREPEATPDTRGSRGEEPGAGAGAGAGVGAGAGAGAGAGTARSEPPAPRSDPPEPVAEAEAQHDDGSWRVNTRQVIGLLDEMERLRELRLRLDERRRELQRGLAQLSRLGMPPEIAEPRAQLLATSRLLAADGAEAEDIVSSLEEGLKAITTVPVRTVLEPLRRAVRDLTRASGKQARLSLVGAEVSLDRRVLEALRAPLVHLVRNAVDHGLELPREREARGKHREGLITVRVEQQGNLLFIELADDGAGLDLPRIRDAAVARRLLTPEGVAALGDAQVEQLIFRPAFSTRTTVSEVSGRGVGLDVVKRQIEALRGQVEVHSVPGQGTRFVLSLPTGLGSSPVLVVRAGEHVLGVPMAAVESSRPARQAELRVARARTQLVYREELLPLLDLGALLGLRRAQAPHEGQPLLVLQSQGRRVALAVDEVVADRELNIRPLPPEVQGLPAYQGAATLARGELLLILRADWLVTGEEREQAAGALARRALVVDDSLTARALHRTALESGGYIVHTASSARQALDLLRSTTYDALVTDIGMAELDGYQLATLVRGRPELDGMPVILVSARDSEEGRKLGREAGADGFLSKKDCVAGRLLAEVAAAIAQQRRPGR